jgi:aminoglycoside phosphotransferase (APT) family kinase protein
LSADPRTALTAWVESATGQRIVAFEPIPGGGSRSTYVVDTTYRSSSEAACSRYLLRVDNGLGPLSKTIFTIGREHRILTALHAVGRAVPAIHHYSAAHDAMLMQFIRGKTSYQTSAGDDLQRRIQANLMREIVSLHEHDVASLGLTEFADCRDVASALERDLGVVGDMYRNLVLLKEPELELALRWLAANVPDRERRASLVHGDVGPGNFLFGEEGEILAIIDWEVAHMGHPLEDLAAVLCRALGVSFGTADEHIANYERESGQRVDRRKLDYFVILVMTRWYVGLNLALSRPSVSQHVAVLATYRQSVAYTLVCMLARQYAVIVPPLELEIVPPPGPRRSTYIHDHVIGTLETVVVPAIRDAFAADRARGASNLAKFLRDHELYGVERQRREEQREIEGLTGASYSGHEQAIEDLCRVARGVALADARPLVECLVLAASRRQTIWAAAMGRMASRVIGY